MYLLDDLFVVRVENEEVKQKSLKREMVKHEMVMANGIVSIKRLSISFFGRELAHP